MNIKFIDKEDFKGLKYYISFAFIVISVYLYSMFTGYRFMSFNESSHTKERSNSRTHFHK
jgi:hypothetical protein